MSDEPIQKEYVYTRHVARHDMLRSLSWALVLIWAGLVFLADNLGMLNRIALKGNIDIGFMNPSAWTLIFLGSGLIILLEVFLRTVLPSYYAPTGGRIVLAVVLIGVGLSNLLASDLIWPLVIMGIGVAILVGTLVRRDRA